MSERNRKPSFTKASKGKGKLIVFEGADGAGKTTQAKLLLNYLRKKKIPSVGFCFPQYQSGWGKMVRRYLDGEFGDVNEVGPYLASMLYAGDRLLAKGEIKKWIDGGKIVVCDRYMASNIAHQVVKVRSQSKESKFIKWLEDFEYRENKIPEPDLVILLTIPSHVAQKFMKMRKLDIHEKNVRYQEEVAKAFSNYGGGKKNWFKVSNVRGSKLRRIEDVHLEIVDGLSKIGVF